MNSKLFTSLSITTCLALSSMANETNLGDVNIIDTALQAHIKSITSEKLENSQASDIKDILKSMPSVVVDGNARYSQKVYVRGLEDKSSNITIDGARMTGQLFHHSGDQTIDAEMLKIGSIELGPNSALSGPGVINGSFVYETKDPSDLLEEGQRFGGKIGTSYQSGYDRKSLDVAVFAKINEKLEFVGIGNLSKDGKLTIPDKDTVKSKQSKLESGLLKFVFKPNEYNTFKLSYNRYEDGGNRQLSGEKPGSSDGNEPYNEIIRDTYTLNYEYTPDNELVNLKAKLYSNAQKLNRDAFTEDYIASRGAPADGKIEQPNRTYENKAVGFDLRNSSIFAEHLLTYGVDYSNEEQSKTADAQAKIVGGTRDGDLVDAGVDGKGKVKQYGIYLEDEIDLDRLILNIGARYDMYKLGGFYNGDFNQLSPKFKASYQLNDELKLRMGYGRIFKGPGLSETLLLSNSITQNSNTKAQTGHNYELGFDYDLSETFNADKSLFGFTAYTYNVDNYMHPTKNASLNNQSDIRIWGLESIISYEKDKVALSLSHTYTDGEETELSSGDKIDPRTAKIHTFKLDTNYKYSKNLSFNYNAEFVPGNKYDYEANTEVKRTGYAVHNLSTTYKIERLKGAKISFGVDNIFNKKYARHTSFGTYFGDDSYTPYEVGRNLKFKFSYKF